MGACSLRAYQNTSIRSKERRVSVKRYAAFTSMTSPSCFRIVTTVIATTPNIASVAAMAINTNVVSIRTFDKSYLSLILYATSLYNRTNY